MSTKASNTATPLLLVDKATTNNTLQPTDVEQGTHARVKWAPMSKAHKVVISWDGPTQVGQQQFTVQGSDTGEVSVHIPANLIGACIGATVPITSEIMLNGQIMADATLDLQVETIPLSKMPAPRFMNLSLENGVLWLDLRKFFRNAKVEFDTYPFIAEGQRLYWYAVGEEHTPDYTFYPILEGHVVTESEAQRGFIFLGEILRDWLKQNTDYSSVTQEFGIIFSGAEALPPVNPKISQLPENAHEAQKTTHNLRQGDPELTLTEPHVPEAPDKTLNPAGVPEGATVCSTVEGMLETDKICFSLQPAPGDEPVDLGCTNGSASGTVCVPIPLSAIIASSGTNIRLSYSLKRGDDTLDSPTLDVKILPLNLPEPKILEANNGVFDPSAGDCGITARLEIWPLAALGQLTWLYLTNNQNNTLLWIRKGVPLSQSEWEKGSIENGIPPHYFNSLPENTKVQVIAKVNFDGKNTEVTATPFPEEEVTIQTVYTISRKVPIAGDAYEVNSSPDGKYIYVSLWGGGVQILDAFSYATITQLPTGYTRMVTFNRAGNLAYLCGNAGLWLIDVVTHTIIKQVLSIQTFDCVFTEDEQHLYVTNYEGTNVFIIRTTDNTVVKTITGFNRSREVVMDPTGTRVYVANLGAGTVSVIDTRTQTIAHTFDNFSEPNGIALSPDGSRLYVSNYKSASLSIIDTTTLLTIKNISCLGNLYTVKLSPRGDLVFIADYTTGQIAVLNPESESVISKIKGLTRPLGIKVSPDGTKLYATSSRELAIINL